MAVNDAAADSSRGAADAREGGDGTAGRHIVCVLCCVRRGVQTAAGPALAQEDGSMRGAGCARCSTCQKRVCWSSCTDVDLGDLAPGRFVIGWENVTQISALVPQRARTTTRTPTCDKQTSDRTRYPGILTGEMVRCD